MKRTIIILSAVAALSACTKTVGLSDEPISIEAKSIQAKAVWIDIVPENNDFYYFYGVVSVEDYNGKYNGSDAVLANSIDKEYKGYWEEYFKKFYSFRDSYLVNGADYARCSDLTPETDYYIYAFPYDDDDNPVRKVVKLRFRTPSYTASDIDFTVTLEGSVFKVKPSNDRDTYYWDYESKDNVEKDYGGSPSMFYHYLIYMYEEYGFLSDRLSKGDDSEDMSYYYDLKAGDEFFLVSAGYNNGSNSPYKVYSVTYNGPDLPGKVEPYEEPEWTFSSSKPGQP